jgi:hypothetical protein
MGIEEQLLEGRFGRGRTGACQENGAEEGVLGGKGHVF